MIGFREIEVEDSELILSWRTTERVAKFMKSDVEYDVEAQKKWLAGSFNKPGYYHWIIQYGGNDVGLLNFFDWDATAKTTSWGFYLGDESALGIGGFIPPYFYNFAFDVLDVNRVKAEVFYDNIRTIKLHLAQGYSFEPDRDHIIEKGTEKILMICMNLEKKDFKSSKLNRLKADLPLINWKYNPFRE